MNRGSFLRAGVALAILGPALPVASFATTHTYLPADSTTDQWTAGTNWDFAPVSGTGNTLVFGPSGQFQPSPVTNLNTNNFIDPFLLSGLTLQGTGSGTPGSPVEVTIGGGTLDFRNFGPVSPPEIRLDADNSVYTVDSNIVASDSILISGEGDASFIFGGDISGGGTLRKTGSSSLTLTGANTFTGGVHLSWGAIEVGSNTALGTTGDIMFSEGILRYMPGVTVDLSSRLRTDRNHAVLPDMYVDTNGQDVTFASFFVSSIFHKQGAGTLTLTGQPYFSHGFEELSVRVSEGTLALRGGDDRLQTDLGVNVYNAGSTLDLGSFDQTVSFFLCSAGDIIGTGTLTFTGVTHEGTPKPSVIGLGSTVSVNLAGTGDLIIDLGGTLTGTNTFSGNLFISNAPGGVAQIGNGGTTGTPGMGNIGNNGVLRFNRSNLITVNNAISGNGRVEQAGSGTLELTGTNTYSGGTTVSSGRLLLGSGNVLADFGAVNVNGGTFDLGANHNETVGAVTLTSGSITGTGASTLAGSGYNLQSGTVDIVLAGNGTVTKTGSGTVDLTANNTYTGATTVSSGTLRVSGGSASTSFAIASGVALDLRVASGNRDNVSAAYSGSGTLVKSGNGTMRWDASAATFAMAAGSLIDVQGGTFVGGSNANEVWSANLSNLQVAAGATFWGAEANVKVNTLTGEGTIRSGYSAAGYSAFTFGVDNGSGTFSGTLRDTDTAAGHLGKFIKAGTGTQILTGTNTFSGTFTIADPGTVQIGNGGTTGTLGTGTVDNGGTLRFDRSNLISVNNVISGTGRVVQSGTGTLNLTGANTYTGTTEINNGTLAFTGTMTGTGALAVESGGTLAGTATLPMPVTLQSDGTIAPGSNGAATLTLSGAVSLNSGCKLNFDLGTASDKLVLNGSYTPPAGGTVIVNVAGLAGFGGGSYPLITGAAGISAGSFSLGAMPPGHTYSLTAAAGTLSLTVVPLSSPSGLAAVAGTAQVSLTWSPAENATGYNVKRSTQTGGLYTVIAANVPGPGHADTGLTNGTRYHYVVSALYSGAESPDSAEASALPLAPLDPTELLAPTLVRDGNLMHLSTASSSLGRSYQLQRSLTLDGNSWENIGEAIPGTGAGLTFDDSPPAQADHCFFRIVILP